MAVVEKTKRIDVLSQPKPIPAGFIDDRRTVYSNNSIAKDWDKKENGTKFVLSDRQQQLVNPKPRHVQYKGDRPSPIWPVTSAALKGSASDRISTLSAAKQNHKDFQAVKSVYTVVSNAARNASASERIEVLSKPKQFINLPIKPDSCWDYSEWKSDVSETALRCEPSGRVIQLATPKELHKSYKECRPVIWNVSRGAKKALPSIRVQQLARPKSRSQYKEDYDSNWWKVTSGAKTAHATPRVEELSMPIPRKIRQKKQAAKT